jgi:hypothetical protein
MNTVISLEYCSDNDCLKSLNGRQSKSLIETCPNCGSYNISGEVNQASLDIIESGELPAFDSRNAEQVFLDNVKEAILIDDIVDIVERYLSF